MRTQAAEIARKRLLRRSRALLRLRETAEAPPPEPRESGADFLLELSEVERVELWDIRRALDAIDAGMFGRCELCLRRIDGHRLDRQPWARRCTRCADSRATPPAPPR